MLTFKNGYWFFKKLLLLALFFIFSLAPNSFAIEQEKNWAHKDLGIEAGFDVYRFTYEEPSMKDQGFMYGVKLSYTISQKEPKGYPHILKLEGRFNRGQVNYDSEETGEIDNIGDYTFELRALGGCRLSFITPYVGIAYRYLNDDTGGMQSTTGAWGYERESNYTYSPIGIETVIISRENWAIETILEYDYFWSGRQISHLSDVPGYPDITNNQDKGYGYRTSLRFIKRGRKIDFVIEPFIRYWKIKDSEVSIAPGALAGMEPRNKTEEIGLNLSALY